MSLFHGTGPERAILCRYYILNLFTETPEHGQIGGHVTARRYVIGLFQNHHPQVRYVDLDLLLSSFIKSYIMC